jgi:hypothetical protein
MSGPDALASDSDALASGPDALMSDSDALMGGLYAYWLEAMPISVQSGGVCLPGRSYAGKKAIAA